MIIITLAVMMLGSVYWSYQSTKINQRKTCINPSFRKRQKLVPIFLSPPIYEISSVGPVTSSHFLRVEAGGVGMEMIDLSTFELTNYGSENSVNIRLGTVTVLPKRPPDNQDKGK